MKTGHAHLDLKLDNVLIGPDQQLKICDLGFAQPLDSKYFEATGTGEYMAPEVLNLKEIKFDATGNFGFDTMKADVWSLGIMLFILEFGQPPWQDANDSDR